MDKKRAVLLVDMDYFYAACEELRRSDLKGKAVIVGADPKGGKGRGVVMTCNYLARKQGIKSAMPISIAYRINPDAAYLPADFPYYEEMSAKVMHVLRGFSEKVEQVSIDEAYVELTGAVGSLDEAAEYAERIKGKVRAETGLSCSVGVSFNKLMAKMASDAAKPDGIKLVRESEVSSFMGNMPLDKLYSVGDKTKARLESMNIKSIGGLAKANKMALLSEFGSIGIELRNYANGIDESALVENYEAKSIGRESTFEHDTSDQKEIEQELMKLSKEVAAEALKAGFAFKNITVKIRYSDFSEHLHSRGIKPSSGAEAIYSTARLLYLDSFERGRKLRKIGVRASGLMKYSGQSRLG